MSANPSRDGFSAGYSSDQVEIARALSKGMTPAGSKARPGRARGSAPSPAVSSGRGGHATLSTRPIASAVPPPNTYHSFSSTTAPRTTHAPGATKSGVINPHFANYTVGASTAAPVFKSPPRARAVSPVRGFGGPAAVSTLKPTSPKKLRSSLLVVDSTQPMVRSEANTMHGGPQSQVYPQSGWVNVPEQSSAYVNTTPAAGGWNASQFSHSVDPRFTAIQSSHPMGPHAGNTMYGVPQGQPAQVDPQSAWVSVPEQSSAHVNPGLAAGAWNGSQFSRGVDPRPTAIPPTHPMVQQQSDSFFGGNNQTAEVQTPVLPLQVNASIDAVQSQTRDSAGQAAHDTDRVRITTNWTDDDPTKPIIPGHLRQPDGEKVVVEIASKAGLPASKILEQGVMTVGISSSIHAPGNAKGNYSSGRPSTTRYQSDVNDSQWMAAASNQNHKMGSNRIPSGDGDVEMSDVQANTRPSVPQGPVEWNSLPTLGASKYASPATLNSKAITTPKPAPTTAVSNENLKPLHQVSAQGFGGFGDVNKNIAADLAKQFGASGQPMSNPFLGNGGQASRNQAQVSGFGAAAMNSAGVNPFQASAVGPGSAEPAGPVAASANGFGAPSAPPASGPFPANAQKGFGASQSNSSTAQMIQNTSNSNQDGSSIQSTLPLWGSVDHSASNGSDAFPGRGFGASVQSAHQGQTAQSNGGWGSAPFDATKLAANIDNDIRRLYGGKAAGSTYETSPFGPTVVRSAAVSNASGSRQSGSGPPVYQVVQESKKATGLASSRWA